VSTINEQLSGTTSRSFSEATTGFNSADIKQSELMVYKTSTDYSICVGVSSYSSSLTFDTPTQHPLTYFMNILPEGPTSVDCPAFQLTSAGGCTDPLISYVLTDSDYNSLPTNFVFMEVPNRRLDWSQAKTDRFKITIIVKGVLPDGNIAGTYSFSVNIVDCVVEGVTAMTPYRGLYYQVNQPQV
jgi:hypothetical protein